jgi:uncharacterized protein YndB with AHSA1/START domain
MTTQTEKEEGLKITRIFNAPSEKVWKAWTKPENYKLWWGPENFTCPVANIDFRVGGKIHSCMRSPDGNEFWTMGIYKEIIPLKKIVVTDSFADKDGNSVPASNYGLPDFPNELLVNITFEETNGKTIMTLNHIGMPQDENLEDVRRSWNQSFDKMEESLKHN